MAGRSIMALVAAGATLALAPPAAANAGPIAGPNAGPNAGPIAAPNAGPAARPVAGAATRIVLERSGGFTGRPDTYVVDRSTVGGRQPLRTAGSWEFRLLRGSYQPRNPCCDRFAYRVTVSYTGGDRKTVSTVQGATAPKILWDVIAQTERFGQRRSFSGERRPAGPPVRR